MSSVAPSQEVKDLVERVEAEVLRFVELFRQCREEKEQLLRENKQLRDELRRERKKKGERKAV